MSDDVFQGNGGDPGAVAKVLRYHVTPREIHADDFLSNEDFDGSPSQRLDHNVDKHCLCF